VERRIRHNRYCIPSEPDHRLLGPVRHRHNIVTISNNNNNNNNNNRSQSANVKSAIVEFTTANRYGPHVKTYIYFKSSSAKIIFKKPTLIIILYYVYTYRYYLCKYVGTSSVYDTEFRDCNILFLLLSILNKAFPFHSLRELSFLKTIFLT